MVKLLLSHGTKVVFSENGYVKVLDDFRFNKDNRSKEIYQLLVNSLSPEKRDRVNKQAKEDVNSLDSMGYAPLHWAVVDNNLEEAKRILELGADPNINNQKDDLLYSAVLKQNKEMVKLLVSHGTKVVFEENGHSRVLSDFRFNKDNRSKEIYSLLISNLSDQQKIQYETVSIDG